ncbi:MAG TPA: sugar ABC transporter substrate-binding protein [Firmicutes bacterium]|nr:sugar ABC transporter substrate-binding protein [Bacillota bacterium]
MRRLFSLVLAVALIMMLCVTASAARTERYAMVVFLKGSEFFNWAYAGMKDAAKMLNPNIQVELQGPAEWDASLEARAIEQLIAKRVNGIIVTAGEANALIPAINKAIDAGIPVITFDSDAPGSKRLSFVGTNNYNAGYAAGKAMAEWLKGKGKVGISTFPGPDHLVQRVKGFKDALAAFGPGIKVVATVNDEGDVAKAETQITAMLQAHPDINGIFCAHGNPGPGAAAAVRNLNMVGKVQIMGFDFGTPVIELIEKGEIRGTVGQDPYLMGYMAMMLAYSANHKTDVPAQNPKFGHVPPVVDTGVTIIYKNDVAKYKKVPKV